MSSDVAGPPSFLRYATVGTLVSVAVALGVAGSYMKNTGTGQSATRDIYCWKSSSGSGLCIRENGNVDASGSYLSNGAPLSTGIFFSNAEGIYVNQKGDTMTGTLILNMSTAAIGLNVRQEAWVQSLHGTGTVATQGTLSGKTLTIMDGTSYMFGSFGIGKTSPATKLEVVGTMSGQQLNAYNHARFPRVISIPLCDGATACATGSGVSFQVQTELDNYILSGATLSVGSFGTTNTQTVQVQNITDNTKFFTTNISVDSGEASSLTAATPYVLGTNAARTISAGDILVVRTDAVHSTPAKAVTLNLVFRPL